MDQAEEKQIVHLLSCGAVIATAAIFGLTYSLTAALIALDLAELGVSEALIGANAAMHAVGVLAMAFLLPRITAALGMRKAVLFSLAAAAILMPLFPAIMPSLLLLFPLRILLGAASEMLFVLSETWLNSLSSEKTRARMMAVYTVAMSAGFALGPLILSVVGTDGFVPYLTGSAFALVAAVFIMYPGLKEPPVEHPEHSNPLLYMRMAPLALAATTLNAAIETAGLTFLHLYALSLGWQETQATQLMPCIMIGAILLQLPLGWLGDKMDRQKLVLWLAAIAALTTLVWPWAMGYEILTYVLLFLWGGVFVGIYTIMLAIVGSRFKGSELIGVYASMGFFWGGGALLGPLLAGVAMEVALHGFIYFVFAACAGFWLMGMLLRKKGV